MKTSLAKKYNLFLFLAMITLLLISCKKNDSEESIIPPIEPTGEVDLDIPGIGRYLYRTSANEYLIPGTGLLDLNEDNWMESYSLFAKIDDSCEIQYYKFPLVSSMSTAKSVVEINDHYFILTICQNIDEYSLNRMMELVKTDKEGNVIWYKSYENTTVVFSMIRSSDNNLLLLGAFRENITNTEIPTFIIKVDQNGNILFRKDYTLEENNHFGENIIDEFNSYVFLSYHYSIIGDYIDSISPKLVKTDKLGNIIFEKTYRSYRHSNLYVASTHLITNFIGGYIFSHVPGGYEGCLYHHKKYLKTLDSEGNVLTQVDIEQACDYSVDYIKQIFQASNGIIYLLGNHNEQWGYGPWQICVLKFNSNGDYLTSVKFDELGERMAECIVETKDGNFMILTNRPSIIKINQNLQIL